MEDNLKGLSLAGAAGPLGQMAPQSAANDVYDRVLLELFDNFVNKFVDREKIKRAEKSERMIISPKQ